MPSRIPAFKPPRVRSRPREETRPNAHQRGYCDASHKAWRLAVLTRDAWTCCHCGRVCGGSKEAHADHVVPVLAGGARYDVANGQTLCVRCHGRKTRQEQVSQSKSTSQGGRSGSLKQRPQ
jgi:5-methylcytosine-specific restriction endonuclease McrA